MEITEDEFSKLVATAIDNIPEQYARHIKNLAFVVEYEPTKEQLHKLHLYHGQTLYGLYEGLPITHRASSYNLVLPDKITIFQGPIQASCHDMNQLKKLVQQTVWHEVAHYFGLDHDAIHKLENPS